MPDINLIGEEEEEKKQPEAAPQEAEPAEPAPEPQESGGAFGNETFSLETREFAPEEKPEPRPEPEKFAEPVTPKVTTPPPDLSSYRRPPRGSRASVFLVVGFLVVVLAVILFWQLQGDEGGETVPGEPTVAEEVGTPGGEPTGQTEAVTEGVAEEVPGQPETTEPEPVRTAPGSAPAYAVESAAISAAAVGALRAFPEDLNFTLISFTGDRFLIEYVGASEAAALSFPDILRGALPVEELRVLAQEQVAANGQSLQKVLLQGSVSAMELGAPRGSIEYLDLTGVRRAVTRLARSNGMVLRGVESRPGLVDDGFELTPLDFRLLGKKANAAAFLDALGQSGINLRIGKVVLVSSDRRGLSDEEVNLAINANVYQPR
jgi:hypothetical protein